METPQTIESSPASSQPVTVHSSSSRSASTSGRPITVSSGSTPQHEAMVVMHTIASDDDAATIEHIESSSDEIAILEAEEAAAEAAAKAAEARLRLLRARRTSSRTSRASSTGSPAAPKAAPTAHRAREAPAALPAPIPELPVASSSPAVEESRPMQGWIPRRMAEEYFNVRESIDFFEAQARAARENIQDRGAGVAQLMERTTTRSTCPCSRASRPSRPGWRRRATFQCRPLQRHRRQATTASSRRRSSLRRLRRRRRLPRWLLLQAFTTSDLRRQ